MVRRISSPFWNLGSLAHPLPESTKDAPLLRRTEPEPKSNRSPKPNPSPVRQECPSTLENTACSGHGFCDYFGDAVCHCDNGQIRVRDRVRVMTAVCHCDHPCCISASIYSCSLSLCACLCVCVYGFPYERASLKRYVVERDGDGGAFDQKVFGYVLACLLLSYMHEFPHSVPSPQLPTPHPLLPPPSVVPSTPASPFCRAAPMGPVWQGGTSNLRSS